MAKQTSVNPRAFCETCDNFLLEDEIEEGAETCPNCSMELSWPNERPTLDEAFKRFPDGCHVATYYDWIAGEWYVEINQEPMRKLVHHDKKAQNTLAETIIEACDIWENGDE